MKVFLSHQKTDSLTASRIASRLKTIHSIDSYLDVIDPYIGGSIELLADHIRDEMGKCTQLLAVISPATANSQWVPWEVGMGTEKNLPLATFSGGDLLPPEFLRKWPYLRSDRDLDLYAHASKQVSKNFYKYEQSYTAERASVLSTRQFFRELRSELGQFD